MQSSTLARLCGEVGVGAKIKVYFFVNASPWFQRTCAVRTEFVILCHG